MFHTLIVIPITYHFNNSYHIYCTLGINSWRVLCYKITRNKHFIWVTNATNLFKLLLFIDFLSLWISFKFTSQHDLSYQSKKLTLWTPRTGGIISFKSKKGAELKIRTDCRWGRGWKIRSRNFQGIVGSKRTCGDIPKQIGSGAFVGPRASAPCRRNGLRLETGYQRPALLTFLHKGGMEAGWGQTGRNKLLFGGWSRENTLFLTRQWNFQIKILNNNQ